MWKSATFRLRERSDGRLKREKKERVEEVSSTVAEAEAEAALLSEVVE